MIEIMTEHHQYVPMHVHAPDDTSVSDTDQPSTEKVHALLFGGDQLTAARARGCQELRMNSDSTTGKLKGLMPTAEDWHTSVILLVVSVCSFTS